MNTRVIWTGQARYAALAVACPTCNVTLLKECVGVDQPHPARADYAAVLGFVTVLSPGALFEIATGLT